MKSFEQFKQRMMESFYNVTNAAGGVPMDGITDKCGIVDVYQTWKPKELRRINAYIGAVLRGQTLEADALLMDLRVRLHVIGLDFEPITIEDEDGRFVVQCSHYKGMGWNAKIGDVEEFESAVGNDLYLVLDYWTNDEGYTQLSGKLIPESEVEEYMEDGDDDIQEGSESDENGELDEAGNEVTAQIKKLFKFRGMTAKLRTIKTKNPDPFIEAITSDSIPDDIKKDAKTINPNANVMDKLMALSTSEWKQLLAIGGDETHWEFDKNGNNITESTNDFDTALKNFLTIIRKKEKTLNISRGRENEPEWMANYKFVDDGKYAKLVTFGGHVTMVKAFVDKETGDIYKPASKTEPVKVAAGNIFSDKDGAEALGKDDLVYIKDVAGQ